LAKPEAKTKARKLRKAGKSIKWIARNVGVSVGSVQRWCIDIRLSRDQQIALDKGQKAIALKALRKVNAARKVEAEKRHQNFYREGVTRIGSLSKRDLFLFGVGLYAGDGDKSSPYTVGMSNMDPQVHKVFLGWLGALGVPRSDVSCQLFLNPNCNSTDEVGWWAEELSLHRSQFGKVMKKLSPTSKGKTKRANYHGVLNLRVHGGQLRSLVGGMLDACLSQ